MPVPARGVLPGDDAADAYEASPVGCTSTLPDGSIVRVNATFASMTGYTARALAQRRMQDLFAVPGRIYFETHLRPLLAMQDTVSEIAIDLVRADGAPLPVILNGTLKRDAAGTAELIRYAIFPASDRRRYEQQLLEARRHSQQIAQAKTELLAMLSHDIRTPLGAIGAAAEILKSAPLRIVQREAVRVLESSATSMLTLVNQILEHGRIEAGALTVHEEPFDLRALLDELVAELVLIARNKGVALEARVDTKVPGLLVGDPTKLAQIFGNLAGNALKFTESGSVTIEIAVLETRPGEVRLRATVRDTGIGIAEDALPRIFEEYGQAHEGIAKRYGGTGLGLAIVRKLLRAFGSELRVQSRVGEGSEFWFELALATRA